MAKEQMTIRLYPETRKRMDSWLEESNSKNRNEFVEKALRFYMGFLGTDDITEYLSDVLYLPCVGSSQTALTVPTASCSSVRWSKGSWLTPSLRTLVTRWKIVGLYVGM